MDSLAMDAVKIIAELSRNEEFAYASKYFYNNMKKYTWVIKDNLPDFNSLMDMSYKISNDLIFSSKLKKIIILCSLDDFIFKISFIHRLFKFMINCECIEIHMLQSKICLNTPNMSQEYKFTARNLNKFIFTIKKLKIFWHIENIGPDYFEIRDDDTCEEIMLIPCMIKPKVKLLLNMFRGVEKLTLKSNKKDYISERDIFSHRIFRKIKSLTTNFLSYAGGLVYKGWSDYDDDDSGSDIESDTDLNNENLPSSEYLKRGGVLEKLSIKLLYGKCNVRKRYIDCVEKHLNTYYIDDFLDESLDLIKDIPTLKEIKINYTTKCSDLSNEWEHAKEWLINNLIVDDIFLNLSYLNNNNNVAIYKKEKIK